MLAAAAARLAREELALHALLDAIETRAFTGDALAAVDPTGRALENLNTPEDVARAERHLAAGAPI